MTSHIKTRAFIGSSSHMIGGLCSLTVSYITFLKSTRNFFCIHKNLALRLYNAAASSASRLRLADSLAIRHLCALGSVFHGNDHFPKQTNRTIEMLLICAHLHGQAVFKMFWARLFESRFTLIHD